MSLWWAVRRPWYVATALALYATLLLVVRDQLVAVPSVTLAGGAGVKVAVFAPLVVCVAQLLTLERRLEAAGLTSVRPVVRADQLMVATVGASALALAAALHQFAGIQAALASGRNVLLLLGLALVVRAWYGTVAAASVTTATLFVSAMVGLRASNDPYPWAVLLEPWNRPHAALASLLLFGAGLALVGRQQTTRPKYA